MIKIISFDMDGTLCDCQVADYKLKKYVISNWSYPNLDSSIFINLYLDGIYNKLSDFNRANSNAKSEQQYRFDLVKYIFNKLSIKITQTKVEEIEFFLSSTRIGFFDFFDGVKEMLIKLRKKFKIIVITNGPRYSQIPKIDQIDLKKYVDHIFIGGDFVEQKPSKVIFSEIIDRLSCDVDDMIHIGDKLETDIQGANNMKMKNIWINDNPSNNFQNNYNIDYIVPNILSVYDILLNL